MTNIGRRIAAFSYLRIASIFGVILLHVSSTLLDNPELFILTGQETVFFRAVIAVFIWCAPCFLMITGALLLDPEKTITIRDCIFKYVRRLVLALMLFGIPFAMLMDISTMRKLSISLIPKALIRILTNQSFAHLWYVYMLIGLYLLLPAIKVFINNCSQTLLEYVLVLLFIFNFALPQLSKMTGLGFAFELPIASCYLFYLLAGYYLCHYKHEWSANAVFSGIGFIVFTAVMVIGTLTDKTGLHSFSTYDNPVAALVSICVFNLFLTIKAPVPEKIWAFDRLTFGVYLIHPVFIHLLFRILHVTPTGTLFVIKTAVISCAVAIASFACIWLMSLIPPINKYVLK